jgi:hypothetical protein
VVVNPVVVGRVVDTEANGNPNVLDVDSIVVVGDAMVGAAVGVGCFVVVVAGFVVVGGGVGAGARGGAGLVGRAVNGVRGREDDVGGGVATMPAIVTALVVAAVTTDDGAVDAAVDAVVTMDSAELDVASGRVVVVVSASKTSCGGAAFSSAIR